MMTNIYRRRPVLDELGFVDKQVLAGLPLVAGVGYALCVTWDGRDYQVVIGWMRKGHGRCVGFVCPVTGKVVERLYLQRGLLVSRHALGVAYASQMRGRVQRWEFQAARLRWRLNDPLIELPLWDGVPVPRRPKTMQWPCYWDKVAKLEALQQAIRKAVAWNEARLD